MRSEITIDLGALRRNVGTLVQTLEGAELWAVVKGNAYGHGAVDCAVAAVGAGATALCVATVAEALELRPALPEARVLVLGPASPGDVARARDAHLDLVVGHGEEIPEGVAVHVKLDTGMGRWGLSELKAPAREIVGVMTHFATADVDLDYARGQLERFRTATAPFAHLTRHAANSAAALRLPESRLDAARCGIAIYGLSPFGTAASDDGLEPVLGWTSEIAQCRLLHAGDSTGYGRRFVAARDTWIGIVPLGYADGFRRDLSGTEVLVAGERCNVVGVISMDALAVELVDEQPPGTPVTIVGGGLPLEAHAAFAGTITYELACGINSTSARADRVVIGA
jgi:alanine racemase